MKTTEPAESNATVESDSNKPNLTPIELQPHVEVVVTSNDGAVLCTLSGENGPLAQALAMAAQVDGFPVTKLDSFMPLGQDCYSVSREFVLSVRGTFLSLAWKDIETLGRHFPETAKYHMVVTV